MTMILCGIVFRKVITIVKESHASKTGWCYPCIRLLSHAFHEHLMIFEHLCRRIVHRGGHYVIKIRFVTFLSSGLSKLFSNSGVLLPLQHQKVERKTRHIQHCHENCLMF